MSRFLLTLCLFLLACLASARICDAGYYYEAVTPQFGNCVLCFRGNYCPGDDKTYQCKGNTFQTNQGATSCVACPASTPTASPTHTYCIPSDKPDDMLYHSGLSSQTILRATTQGTHYGGEVQFGKGVLELLVTFRMYRLVGQPEIYTVFAATKSAAPSKENFEYMGHGANITIALPRPAGNISESVYLPFFFTIYGTSDNNATGASEGSRAAPYVISTKDPVTTLSFSSFISYILFDIVDVSPGEEVTVHLEGTSEGRDSSVLTSYVSNDPIVKYPCMLNYNYRDLQNTSPALMTLKLPKTDTGVLHFSSFLANYSDKPYNLRVRVETSSSLKKAKKIRFQ